MVLLEAAAPVVTGHDAMIVAVAGAIATIAMGFVKWLELRRDDAKASPHHTRGESLAADDLRDEIREHLTALREQLSTAESRLLEAQQNTHRAIREARDDIDRIESSLGHLTELTHGLDKELARIRERRGG